MTSDNGGRKADRERSELTSEKKPEAWVLWGIGDCVLTACSEKDGVWRGAESITGMDEKMLTDYGWRIRPVKLVFLDEEADGE